MGTRMLLAVVAWLSLWLAVLPPPVALAPPVTCTKDQCLANTGAMSDPMAACCRQEFGCPCGHYSECDQFKDGIVPPNKTFYVDFGSMPCTCKSDRKLECVRTPCPVIPPDCKNIITLADTCARCGDPAPARR